MLNRFQCAVRPICRSRLASPSSLHKNTIALSSGATHINNNNSSSRDNHSHDAKRRSYGVKIGGEKEESIISSADAHKEAPSTEQSFPPMRLDSALQEKLEWRESVLEDGSILYRHPTYEQVMSIKMARMLVYRAVSKRKREAQREEQALRSRSAEFIPKKTKKQEEADERKIIEQVHRDIVPGMNTLSPDAILEVRRLRTMDPITYNSQNLARMFHVNPELINMVSKDPEDKVRHDLRVLKEWNRNSPRKSTRQPLNR